jgi:hypothetical protein
MLVKLDIARNSPFYLIIEQNLNLNLKLTLKCHGHGNETNFEKFKCQYQRHLHIPRKLVSQFSFILY